MTQEPEPEPEPPGASISAVSSNDELGSTDEDFCIQNDKFCSKTRNVLFKIDESFRWPTARCSRRRADFALKMMNFALKMMNFAFK